MQDPIIIAGCPRSGTSLAAGVLNACGAFTGPHTAWPDNPKGTYENLPVLSLLSRRWRKGFNPDPDVMEKLWRQGYVSGPWLIKLTGAMLLDQWQDAARHFPSSRWVLVRRDTADILASHQARRDLDAELRILKADTTLEQIKSRPDIESMEIHSQDLISGNYAPMKKAVAWLGLAWDPAAVNAFVDPSLWHHMGQIS